jgi:predicted membrane protein
MWAIFGSRKEKLPSDWDAVTARAVFGSADLDASETAGGGEHAVEALAVLGSVKLIVPRGARVHASGSSVFGSRDMKVASGDGPEIRLHATAVLGSVEVRETDR